MIPATTDPLRPPTPYPGLRPFLEEDAWRFFGRGEQTSRMLECLETRRFLAVVGASGCGKSSLVYAGLLPALKEGWLNGGLPNWKMVTLRLGEAPLHNLATALHQKLSPDPTATDPYALPVLRNTLEEGRFGLLRAIENAQIGDETNVLVFVDQFEELFRYRERAEQEQRAAGSTQSRYDRANESIAFVNLLLTAAQQTRQPVYVMLSMRSDFLGNCDLFQGLPELISQSQFLTPRMTRDQLREAIVEPLKLFQAKFEPGLVDRILNEVGTEHDQLPLMQHALMRTWNIACPKADAWKTESIVVSAKHYLHPKVQGVAHALDLHAEEVYQRFADRPDPAPTAPAVNQTGPLAQYDFVQWFRSQFRPNATPVVSRRQEFCERLFRSLCDTNNSGQLVRRLVKIEQIAAEADPAVDNADPQLAQAARERVIQEIIAVAQPFLAPDCSLLNASPTVSDTQPLTGETTLDISHEALLRQWGHCKTWVATERDSARKWRRVVEQATLARDGRAAHFSRADLVPLEQWRKEQKPTQAWTRRYAATVDSPVDFETAEKFLQASGIRAIALSVVLFLLPLVVVGLSGWLYWSKQKAAADKVIAEQVEEKRKADDKRNSDENQYITARVTKLLGANEPSQIAETLEELKGKDSKWQTELHAKLPKSLVELARTLPESRKRKQLNAALALVSLAPAGESLDVAIQCIVDEILRPGTTPQQITLLRDFLTPYADQAEPKLWPWVKPEANRVQRLRAAAALAGIPSAETALPATATGKWKELGTDIVRELLSVSPLELKAWTDTLGPRREFLEKELTTIYYESRGKENRRAQREAAALVLAEAWSDVPEKIIGDTEEKLIGWLADADSPAEFLQFATVLKNKLDDRRINL
ncbi:MAG: hypothetical protein NT069_10660, partial [Planctomycetota bacterium]|nr:hypothetical protein [Planctomycetota bacterium]